VTSNNPIISGVNAGFKPNPRLTITQWAERYRYLTSEASAETGLYRVSRTPFAKEIMDVLSPTDPTQQVKVIKGTQLGLSTIGDNVALCYLHYYPCPILYVLPTEGLAKGTSKRRLTPAIKAIPELANRIVGGKTKDDVGEVMTKSVAGGNLQLGWSNSTASFRSFSARVVILDDVDGYGSFAEGDVMELGKARADAFANKKVYINSTPTTEGGNIDLEFLDSDQREFFMPCPDCDIPFPYRWEYFHYTTKENGSLDGDVTCSCPNCGTLIPEYKKTKMMSEGAWIPQNKGHIHKGYSIPSFYSPVGWLSWNQIAIDFIKAHRLLQRGDERLMQVWQNTRNAKSWKSKLEGVDITNAHERVEEYEAVIPNEVYVLTAGVDSQDDRFEIEVLGHGKNGETWSIDYKVIGGDPQFAETQAMLDSYLSQTFERLDGTTMKILGTGIDSGGHRTKAVYAYCKPRANQNIFAFKGANTQNAPVSNKTMLDMQPNKLTLFMIGVNMLKDDFYANLAITDGGANFCHFPNRDVYNDKYFKMLTAEKRNEAGKYEKVRTRNEALDCRVYAIAVLTILNINISTLPRPIIHVGSVAKVQTTTMFNQQANITPNNFLDEF